MQTHFQERDLTNHARAILAVNPVGGCVIFIHGFGGDAINTWSNFHTMVPLRPEFSGYDLIFYNYDGLYSELVASAALFREFADQLLTSTPNAINACLPNDAYRDASFSFNNVIIVAHSLGAVISRWALLDATKLGRQWVTVVKLLLFAPAHRGANAALLAREAIQGFPILNLFSSLGRFQSPLLDQLLPTSPELTTLREETERLLPTNPHLKAKRVVLAEYEKIVSNLPFSPHDPPPHTLAKATHITVCKPTDAFVSPLDALVAVLAP